MRTFVKARCDRKHDGTTSKFMHAASSMVFIAPANLRTTAIPTTNAELDRLLELVGVSLRTPTK
jgi:hypothetical protein